jgi:aspartate-semialdehyde dehydrogenase
MRPEPHGATAGARIAFFGPTTLLAREIRNILEGGTLLVSDVRLYDEAEEGTLSEFAGEALAVTRPDQETLGGLDLAFMCGPAAATAGYLEWAGRCGFVAIDLSGASSGMPGVPLVHVGINPADIAAGGRPHPVIAAPQPLAHNLAALGAAVRGERIEAVGLRPASDLGEKAVDELYRQTVALLNFTSVPSEEFGRQQAFNLLPAAGVPASLARGTEERLREETRRLLGLGAEGVALDTAFAPMFHGHACHVVLVFAAPVERAAVHESLAQARGVRVIEDPGAFSPVELAEATGIDVLLTASSSGASRRVALWSYCDNLRGGAALNAVRIAERVADMKRAGIPS